MTVRLPIQPGDGDPRHGTTGGYSNHRCRCDLCSKKWRDYCRENSHRAGRRRPYDEWIAEVRRRAAERDYHGTEYGYTKKMCRCGLCAKASSEARAIRRQRPNPAVHNKSAYSNGCRCDICREAHRVYQAARYKITHAV